MNKEQKNIETTIPTLNPFQFDDYLFDGWNAPTGSCYDDFHIARIESYKNHLKLPVPPHRRSVYYFMFVQTGEVIRTKLLNEHRILPNQFFLLGADITSTIEYLSPDTTGFYCHFKPEILNQSYFNIDFLREFPFFELISEPVQKISEPSRIIDLIETLENEYKQNQKERFELIAVYLLTLLIEIKLANPQNYYDKDTPKSATHLVMRYKKVLTEYMYEKIKVAEFADILSVTPNHLNKTVKAVTGKSAHQLLSEMRIMEAKVLLKQSRLSISEIAWKTCKMDQSNFSRFFKTQTQLTPNKYRKMIND